MSQSNLWQATAGAPVPAPPLEGVAKADVAIVGGGFTGCSAALHLSEAGASVRLLEADEVGFGGSGRNAGLVNAGVWMEPDNVEATLGREQGSRLNDMLGNGPGLVFSLVLKHQMACDAVNNGTLHCAHSASGLAELERRARQYSARGAKVELLSRDAARERLGTEAYMGALLDHRAGTIQPLAYCRGLARAAQKAGAVLHQQSPVTGISREGGKWHVSTARGKVVADKLLVATDSYHAGLETRGEPQYVPVHYFQFATKPLSSNLVATILPGRHGAWDTAPVMSSFRLDAAGRLIVGAMGSLDGPGGAIHRNWARRKLAAMFPQAADQEFEHGWFGRIGMTADHLPRICRVGPGAYSIYGYNGRGISPGTVFGKAMAECLVKEDESALPIAPVDSHSESFRFLKQLYFETGVTAVHLVAQRS